MGWSTLAEEVQWSRLERNTRYKATGGGAEVEGVGAKGRFPTAAYSVGAIVGWCEA